MTSRKEAIRALNEYQKLVRFELDHEADNEEHVLRILAVLEDTRQNWWRAEQEAKKLRSLINQYHAELDAAKTDVANSRETCTRLKGDYASLLSRYDQSQQENAVLAEKLEHVRSLLNVAETAEALAYIGDTAAAPRQTGRSRRVSRSAGRQSSGPDDLTFDQTNDNVFDNHFETSRLRSGATWIRSSENMRGRKRTRDPSAPPIEEMKRPSLEKREKSRSQERRRSARRSALNRSVSEPQLLEKIPSPLVRTPSTGTVRTLRPCTSSASLSSKHHVWTSHAVIRPEVCHECENRCYFGRRVYVCTNCATSLCETCHEDPPLPCVPKVSTPRKQQRGYLVDFTPSEPPMIPHLLIHCFAEIEYRGLREVGLYRVPGPEKAVVKLTEEFLWSKKTPSLRETELPMISSCVKRFLMWLREPVIPRSEWYTFWRAVSETPDDVVQTERAVKQAISMLPQPNRETLAFILLHLQVVANHETDNKMDLNSLSMIFAPNVVGNSCANPTPQQAFDETPRQQKIMQRMLSIPTEWLAARSNAAEVQALYGSMGPVPAVAAALRETSNTLSDSTRQRHNTSYFPPPTPSRTPAAKTPSHRRREKLFNKPVARQAWK